MFLFPVTSSAILVVPFPSQTGPRFQQIYVRCSKLNPLGAMYMGMRYCRQKRTRNGTLGLMVSGFASTTYVMVYRTVRNTWPTPPKKHSRPGPGRVIGCRFKLGVCINFLQNRGARGE